MLRHRFLVAIFFECLNFGLHASNPKFVVEELNYKSMQQIEEVCELFEDSDIQEMTGGKTYSNQMHLLSAYTQASEQEYGKYFICRSTDEAQKLCGILTCIHNAQDGYAEYKAIAVHKDYRRQNVASLMMRHVEHEYLKPMPIQKILIGVFSSNSAAIKCYHKQNFYIPFRDRAHAYYRIVCAKLSNQPTKSIGFYMHKDL